MPQGHYLKQISNWTIVRSRVKMNLVGKVWGHIPTKLQIDSTGNHGVMSLGHQSECLRYSAERNIRLKFTESTLFVSL